MPAGSATSDRIALVVDDNQRFAGVAAAMLEAYGWRVDKAKDGFEAIVRFSTRTYDALLLDYRLPGMDGRDVLTWVRKNVARAPEVLLVSSEPKEFLAQEFAGMGVRAILSKPLSPSELIRALPS